jgi:hypothetical protein
MTVTSVDSALALPNSMDDCKVFVIAALDAPSSSSTIILTNIISMINLTSSTSSVEVNLNYASIIINVINNHHHQRIIINIINIMCQGTPQQCNHHPQTQQHN